jgi:hypothetical protein
LFITKKYYIFVINPDFWVFKALKMTLGEKIAILRKQLKGSQEDLAKEI